MFHIHLLPASFGDALLVEYGETRRSYILIDGGPYFAFPEMIASLKRVAPDLEELELLIITHIDIDHIDGIITLLNRAPLPFKIREVWFNGYKELLAVRDDLLGALQGEYLSRLIDEKAIPHNSSFEKGVVVVEDYTHLPQITLPGGMEITLLSPGSAALTGLLPAWEKETSLIGDEKDIKERWDKDTRYQQEMDDLMGDIEEGLSIAELQKIKPLADRSAANRSSIAFIGRYEGKSCLFSGDAPTDSLLSAITPMLETSGLDRLKVDAWKLAHHGSRKSTTEAIMQKIESKHILVSSDGRRYQHPDRSCIAKLLKYKASQLSLHFNYQTEFNKEWADDRLQKTYGYQAFYPLDKDLPGITLEL